MDAHEERLGRGDVALAELRGDVRRLTTATEHLTDCVSAATRAVQDVGSGVALLGQQVATAQATANKPGEWLKAIAMILLQWGVPIIALSILWAAMSSGALGIRPAATTTTTTTTTATVPSASAAQVPP